MKNKTKSESWAVYLGDPTPTGAKVAGRLSVTDADVVFKAGTALEQNAGLLLGLGIPAYRIAQDIISIPLAGIAATRIERTKVILKSLVVRLVSGEEIVFHFGAASPNDALGAITSHATHERKNR